MSYSYCKTGPNKPWKVAYFLPLRGGMVGWEDIFQSVICPSHSDGHPRPLFCCFVKSNKPLVRGTWLGSLTFALSRFLRETLNPSDLSRRSRTNANTLTSDDLGIGAKSIFDLHVPLGLSVISAPFDHFGLWSKTWKSSQTDQDSCWEIFRENVQEF